MNAQDFETLKEQLTCPILNEIPLDPVVASDGHIYSRHNLELWMAKHDNKSPMTREKIQMGHRSPALNGIVELVMRVCGTPIDLGDPHMCAMAGPGSDLKWRIRPEHYDADAHLPPHVARHLTGFVLPDGRFLDLGGRESELSLDARTMYNRQRAMYHCERAMQDPSLPLSPHCVDAPFTVRLAVAENRVQTPVRLFMDSEIAKYHEPLIECGYLRVHAGMLESVAPEAVIHFEDYTINDEPFTHAYMRMRMGEFNCTPTPELVDLALGLRLRDFADTLTVAINPEIAEALYVKNGQEGHWVNEARWLYVTRSKDPKPRDHTEAETVKLLSNPFLTPEHTERNWRKIKSPEHYPLAREHFHYNLFEANERFVEYLCAALAE